MNPEIALLARLPRGAAWHSRLLPFENEIRHRREAGESYRQIAAFILKQGLKVSHSAVHSFVRARARKKNPQYRLPDVPLNRRVNGRTMAAEIDQFSAHPVHADLPSSVNKKYRFVPTAKSTQPLLGDDAAFNEPFD